MWLEFQRQQTEAARQYEANIPPGQENIDNQNSFASDQPSLKKQAHRPGPFGFISKENYTSPPRVNNGHTAKTKSGTLGMTPNSTKLNSSLKELSLEKEKGRGPTSTVGSEYTAGETKIKPKATKK
jgi:hypothetical protein